MKTYEQMAQDALRRIDDENRVNRQRRQNTFRISVAVGCAVLTVLVGAGVPFLTKNEQPRPSGETVTPIATSVLQVAYLSENGWDRRVMKEQIETQIRYKLSVIDTRGLTTAQREALRQEKVKQLEQELSEFYSEYSNGSGGVNSAWDNALFVTLRGGVFQLDLNEEKTVESIHTECNSIYGEAEFGIHSKSLVGQKVAYQAKWYDGTEQRIEKETRHGNIYLHAMGVTLDGATYDRIQSDGVFYIRWKPSAKLYETLNDTPDRPLSEFSDRMTITVNYTDGSRDNHEIDIVFRDDGNIGAVYHGGTTAE